MQRTQINFDTSTLPPDIRAYAAGASIWDSSCSPDTRTILIEASRRYFLKMDKPGKLAREAELTRWFHGFGLAPAVIHYISTADGDYLLTEALEGEDGIAEVHLAEPKRLAKLYGELLAVIHSLPRDGCPFPQRNRELLTEAEANIQRAYSDRQIHKCSFTKASIRFAKLKDLPLEEVVLHGDYCLPNIILQDWTLSGWVDWGSGGIGDRHWDLFWGIWTLSYNLGTDSYRDVFLDAYGRDKLDTERLELCKLIAGFTQ